MRILGVIWLGILLQLPVPAQRNIAGALRIRLALEQLNVLGNALMIGAHPDDENTGLLARARPLIAAIPGPQAALTLKELDETIALCAGLWLDATAERHAAVPGDTLQVSIEVINRSRAALSLASVNLEGFAAEGWVNVLND